MAYVKKVKENEIYRKEILTLLGISYYTHQNLVKRTDFKIPHKIGEDGNYHIFDREKILAWIDTDPIGNIDKLMSDIDRIDLFESQAFLGGRFDRKDQKKYYANKKQTARINKPETQSIHLKSDF
jgi:hypothetical protein